MQGRFMLWVYVAVAALTALTAFGIAQLRPGVGTMFVPLASTLWTAYAVRRQRKMVEKNV